MVETNLKTTMIVLLVVAGFGTSGTIIVMNQNQALASEMQTLSDQYTVLIGNYSDLGDECNKLRLLRPNI